MSQALGIYVSVPFCRAKCTYCNFASGVFGAERMDSYVDRLGVEIRASLGRAESLSAELPEMVDTVYFGGGTPSLLGPGQVRSVFAALQDTFRFHFCAEITLECAPGQLAPETLEELQRHGLNRISFGVQSFSDTESKAVGRTHTRDLCLAEIERMRSAGVGNLNLDLIVGLPHQTRASWLASVRTAIDSGVPHVSVYMLEVDEDSRLGREVLAEGSRYGAAAIPREEEVAEWYTEACEMLDDSGVAQYEISNFARAGFASRHNLKYWRREPYLGFGLDAHSMLLFTDGRDGDVAVRWVNTDGLEQYLETGSGSSEINPLAVLRTARVEVPTADRIGRLEAFEETVFLGLRLSEGIDLNRLCNSFGERLVEDLLRELADPEEAGLIERRDRCLRLTPQGRLVSNEVFGRVLVSPVPAEA